jgi:hypothetical protein
MKEPRELSHYSDWTTALTAMQSGFDSRQVQEIILFSAVFRPALGPTNTAFCTMGTAAGA